MTHLLMRVRDAHEATQAAAVGIDAVEFCVQHASRVEFEIAGAVRAGFPGVLRLRFDAKSVTPDNMKSAASVRADEIAVDIDASSAVPTNGLSTNLRAVAVLSSSSDSAAALQNVRDRVYAVMLDTGPNTRLVDKAGIAALDSFASACRESQLAFGLAGGLEPPDVARLLLLEPDMLGFDTAFRKNHQLDGILDPQAMHAVRALVPKDKRYRKAAIAHVIDRIFVSNFEISLGIGAYQAEHHAHQRVRFSVDADVVRVPVAPRDMRDVFSYDIIIETIRVLAQRAHVTFVETLAEEVAATLLTHEEVRGVTVKVEKLDVVAGAVGIEITRRRAAA